MKKSYWDEWTSVLMIKKKIKEKGANDGRWMEEEVEKTEMIKEEPIQKKQR